jgi:hypothetical protein
VSSQDPLGVAWWNSTCAQGKAIASPAAWGSVAKKMNPEYSGARPKMLIYHGGGDKTINPQNYEETTKQWCGVFEYEYTKPVSLKETDGGFITTIWGANLKGVLGRREPHNLKYHEDWDMEWLGLKKEVPPVPVIPLPRPWTKGSRPSSARPGGISSTTTSINAKSSGTV